MPAHQQTNKGRENNDAHKKPQTQEKGPDYNPTYIDSGVVPRDEPALRRLTPDNVLQLQRTIGNRAVGALLYGARPRPVVQTKLTDDSPTEAYEQDTDRETDQVVRTPAPQTPIGKSAGEAVSDHPLPSPNPANVTPVGQRPQVQREFKGELAQYNSIIGFVKLVSKLKEEHNLKFDTEDLKLLKNGNTPYNSIDEIVSYFTRGQEEERKEKEKELEKEAEQVAPDFSGGIIYRQDDRDRQKIAAADGFNRRDTQSSGSAKALVNQWFSGDESPDSLMQTWISSFPKGWPITATSHASEGVGVAKEWGYKLKMPAILKPCIINSNSLGFDPKVHKDGVKLQLWMDADTLDAATIIVVNQGKGNYEFAWFTPIPAKYITHYRREKRGEKWKPFK